MSALQNIRPGSRWVRLVSGMVWRVVDVTPADVIEIEMVGGPYPEREKYEIDGFLSAFERDEPADCGCKANPRYYGHRADCAYAKGN